MSKKHADIWVLTDSRTGNSLQAIALAEALNMPFEIKNLEYNFLAALPNFLLPNKSLQITKSTRKSLIEQNAPKLIISAGRRTAHIAKYLKGIYKDTRFVQIMKPGINSKVFDLIILPQHDKFYGIKNNVIRTIGTVNNIKTRIFEHKNKAPIDNFIGVLIGGDTKGYKFTKSDSLELATLLEKAIEASNTNAFITFSRRTPEFLKELFRKKFQDSHIIYDPKDKGDNPFLTILKHAKFLVLTCDSVSMCSEAASSGHPLYIYTPKNFTSKKHKYFIQQLIDLRIARAFDRDNIILEDYKYEPLDEISKVVKAIKDLL